MNGVIAIILFSDQLFLKDPDLSTHGQGNWLCHGFFRNKYSLVITKLKISKIIKKSIIRFFLNNIAKACIQIRSNIIMFSVLINLVTFYKSQSMKCIK